MIPLYKGKLFYARDAFDGLNAMDLLTQGTTANSAEIKQIEAAAGNGNGSIPDDTRDTVVQIAEEATEDLVGEDAKLGKAAARISPTIKGDASHTQRSDVREDIEIPKAPFTVQGCRDSGSLEGFCFYQ